MTIVFIIAAVLLIAFGGLLAAAESAISVLSRADLQELANRSRQRRALEAISTDVGAHLNAIIFMRVVAETTAAVLVTITFATHFEDWWWALLCSALVMIVVSFVIVGSSPRSVGREYATPIIRASARVVHAIRVLLGPLAAGLVAVGNRVTPGRPRTATFSSEQQLLSMVDEATELDVLEEQDRELIHSIFDFNQTVVREVMIPRTDMITIESDASVTDALRLFFGRGNSRMPVTGDDVDEVLGILYLRDVARVSYEQAADLESMPVVDIARPALFVPESQKADDLLRQMQLESNHLAMVVDEYGGIAGLVTMEDLIEELVGDISDEYDRAFEEVKDLGDGRFRVSARLPIDELGELFGIDLDDDDVDSVGGLLAKSLGRIPLRGDATTTDGVRLVADRIEGRRRRLTTVIVERDVSLADSLDPDVEEAVDSER